MKILITGGAGFIGSHLVKHLVKKYQNYDIINLDSLTYAGNLSNLTNIQFLSNYRFIQGDIRNYEFITSLFDIEKFDCVIHLAAESHVDNSIEDPFIFAQTNVLGTLNLLECFKNNYNAKNKKALFFHVSTDEVYGSLEEHDPSFSEDSKIDPNSPYSASKASSDLFVKAYSSTFEIPYIISNCSNNYGENQFEEKLIPKIISKAIKGETIPIYGDGENIRDWLYVKDHVRAIDALLHSNIKNQKFNIGGGTELSNNDLVKRICNMLDSKLNRKIGISRKLIKHVKDRPGHDKRYSVNSKKLIEKVNWLPKVSIEDGLGKTIDWYISKLNNK